MKEWERRYKGAPLTLGMKMKLHAELEKARVQMLIQKNKQLASFIGNIQAPYLWLYNSIGLHGENPQDPMSQLNHRS